MPQLRILAAAIGLLISSVLIAPIAHAAPTLTLPSTIGAPGAVTTVNGAGFVPSSLVDVYFDYDQVGFVATDAAGTFSYGLTIPSTAHPGNHTITGVAHNGSKAAQQSYLVRTNWPQWRGNASGKGLNRFENVLNSSTVQDLDLEVAPPGASSVTSAPVTAGSYYYVVGNDGHLRAYRRTNDTLRFDVDPTAQQLVPPAVGGGVVVVAGVGLLQARNASTGALVWRAVLPAGVGAPVIADGVVYVVAQGSTTLTNGVYAFDVNCRTGGATCTPKWIGPGGSTNGSFFYPENSVALGGGRVYARLGNDLVSFAVGCGSAGATCTKLGSVTGISTGTSPVFANNYVYSVEGSAVTARRAGCLGCVAAWSGTLPGSAHRTVAVAGSKIYVTQGSSLVVFNSSCGAASCSPVWSTNTGGSTAYPPTVANGVVYLPTSNDVFAYPANCYTGCPALWTAGSGGTYSNAPYATVTISDGRVYSASSSGLLVYSTTATPFSAKVDPSRLKPSPRFAEAERRAERRLAG